MRRHCLSRQEMPCPPIEPAHEFASTVPTSLATAAANGHSGKRRSRPVQHGRPGACVAESRPGRRTACRASLKLKSLRPIVPSTLPGTSLPQARDGHGRESVRLIRCGGIRNDSRDKLQRSVCCGSTGRYRCGKSCRDRMFTCQGHLSTTKNPRLGGVFVVRPMRLVDVEALRRTAFAVMYASAERVAASAKSDTIERQGLPVAALS